MGDKLNPWLTTFGTSSTLSEVLSDEAVRSWLFGHKLLFGIACGVIIAVAVAFVGKPGAAAFALVFGVFAGALVLAERVTAKD